HRLPGKMTQGELHRFGLRPQAVAFHDRPEIDVFDLDVRAHPAHTPTIHLTCKLRVPIASSGIHSFTLSFTASCEAGGNRFATRYSRPSQPRRPCPSPRGATFDSLAPATGQVIAHAAAGGGVDIERAVAAARKAFESAHMRSSGMIGRWRMRRSGGVENGVGDGCRGTDDG